MASIISIIAARNNAASPPGAPVTSLTPTWVFLVRQDTLAAVTQPTVTEVGHGLYKFSYDAEASGEAVGQIDFGATLANPGDRYLDVVLTRDSSRIQNDLGAGGTLLDLTQAVPTSNTAQTVGDALNAARAQGFGKWVISGTTLTLYAGDGTTVVRTFTLNSATAPTQRS